MKYTLHQLALLLLAAGTIAFGQLSNPKYEMRGIWIASLGIDWPSSTGTTASVITAQKSQLASILDKHKAYGMNAMFFHVRPVCDAVYKSSYEPWSQYVTGKQGNAPSDASYDPLRYAITEAHKRGIELHAWLNPYRALLSGGSTSGLSANHIINTKPSWIIKCETSQYRFLNPGLPEVREYVVKIVMDIVRRYDVDGIHFDDYFYPYSDYGAFNDDAAFAAHSYGFTDRAAWRKNNVNLLLKAIKDSIAAVKPYVKFGVSPSGNTSVNSSIFCSPADWLLGKYVDTTGTARSGGSYIDYIMPQLYWVDFYGRLPLWSDAAFLNNRYLYIGHAAYRFAEPTFPANECSKQILLSRGTYTSRGSVYFSSKSVTGNLANCADSMQRYYYATPSINHRMNWKTNDEVAPNAPTNLRLETNLQTGKKELRWDAPAAAADGDTAFFYIVYRYEKLPGIPSYGSNMVGVTGETYLNTSYARYSSTKGAYYSVSCIDRYTNESSGNPVLLLDTTGNLPGSPVARFPAAYANVAGTSTAIKWSKTTNTESYLLQVSLSAAFDTGAVLYLYELKDTSVQFNSVMPGQRYYWRVKAANVYGHSRFSDVAVFQNPAPYPPVLAFPLHNADSVYIDTRIQWRSHFSATSYQLQVATDSLFAAANSLVDVSITDTSYVKSGNYSPETKYFWRVKSKNQLGESDWSNVRCFVTGTTTVVEKPLAHAETNKLEQNYPNPFNAATKIRFAIPLRQNVRLEVYDVIGNLITELCNSEMEAGQHESEWNGTDLHGRLVPSGMYFIKLQSGGYAAVRKMIMLK